MKLSRKIAVVVFTDVLLAVFAGRLVFLLQVNFLIQIILLLVIAVVITLICCLILIRQIVKPIRFYNQVIQIIAKGNLSPRIPYLPKDELGELGQNINIMIKNLASALQNMAFSLRNEKIKEKQLFVILGHIEQEKAKNEALLTNIWDALVAIDKFGKIILFNRAAGVLTGFSAGEAINIPYRAILKFLDEKTNLPVEDFIGKALGGFVENKKKHLIILSKNGKKIPVSPTLGLISEQGGEIGGLVIVLRDITYERKFDQLKDEFLSVASHELRTPMTAIKGLISMIFEGDFGQLNEQLKDPLRDVALSTDRLIQLVNDMLDVSRIEAGRLKFRITDEKVYGLINEAVKLMQPLALAKGIKLEIISNTLATVMIDASKVKEILNNLIGNAMKFTDKGGIAISYQTAGEQVKISVSDTGQGISPGDQQKLFSKFSQISSEQTGRPKGTGLGLYISREYAKIMGGDLWIEHSEVGKGSVFSFLLPLSGTQLAQKIEENLKNVGTVY